MSVWVQAAIDDQPRSATDRGTKPKAAATRSRKQTLPAGRREGGGGLISSSASASYGAMAPFEIGPSVVKPGTNFIHPDFDENNPIFGLFFGASF